MTRGYFSTVLAGRIGFTVKNGFAEIFLKYCKENKITLYNLSVCDGILLAEIRYSDKEKIFTAAQKSGMDIHIDYRRGLPDFVFRYRKRLGIPIGLLLFCIITAMLSSIVWSIDIAETELIKEEEIQSLLNELGIVKGAFVDSIQTNDAEYYMHNKLEELAWIEINIVGSRVFVSVIERYMQEDKEISVCSDIVAAKDGEVIRADIFTGEGKILPGTAVVKGDVLVKGISEDENGNINYYDSDAHIWARTRNIVNSSAAKYIDVYAVDKCKDKYLVDLFGLMLPLCLDVKNSSFTESRSYMRTADVVFPVGIVRQNFLELKKIKAEITEEQARLIAFYDFCRSSEIYYRNTQVLERVISVTCETQITFTGKYLCIENIAEKKEVTATDYSSDNR